MKYVPFLLLLAAQLACMESATPLDPAPPTAVVLQGATAEPLLDAQMIESASLPIYEPAAFDVRTVCAIEFLNVRGGPGTNWSVLYQLAAGERVRVREVSRGWAMVSTLDYVPPYSPQWVKLEYLCP